MGKRLKEERIWVGIPFYFEETNMNLNSTNENKKHLLMEQEGKFVLLKDDHSSRYSLARISIDPDDEQCYYAQLYEGEHNSMLLQLVEKRCHYHDLSGLMIQKRGKGGNYLRKFRIIPFFPKPSYINKLYSDLEEKIKHNPE